MNKKFTFLYFCKCGNMILKAEEYTETQIKVKCQKCGEVYNIDDLEMKRLSVELPIDKH